MCGIVGMVTQQEYGFNMKNANIFSQLLWADMFRGEDSTGVFGVNKYGNFDWLKQATDVSGLVKTKDFDEFSGKIFQDYRMVVGHNRKATRGATVDSNAHPFIEENKILVHNGTLLNWQKLTKEKVDVDSHAILHSINENGYEETIANLDGAFTLVWYDAEEKTLYAIRNEDRPLFVANTAGCWYFASERKMLEWILDREGEKISRMYDLKPGTLHFWRLEDKKYTMWHRPLKLMEKKVIVPVENTNLRDNYLGGMGGYYDDDYVYHPKQEALPPETKKEEPKEKEEDPVGSRFSPRDFKIGTQITAVARAIRSEANASNANEWRLFGHWSVDPSINISCASSSVELAALERHITEEERKKEHFVFEFTITHVSYTPKTGKIGVFGDFPVPHIPTFDMAGSEISKDEYELTTKTCSYCGKETEFKDLEKGTFEFRDPDEFDIMCGSCYDDLVLKGRQ